MKSRIYISLITAIFLTLLLSSCDKLKGKGGNITISPDTTAFTSMNIDMPCDINITYGDSLSFSITAQENIIKNISYRIESNVLYMEFVQTAFDYNRIQLDFTMPDFRGLSIKDDVDAVIASPFETTSRMRFEIEGFGKITFQDTIRCYQFIYDNFSGTSYLHMDYLECNNFNYTIRGLDGTQISGKANTSNINISGQASFDAFNFETDKSNIDISGLVEDMKIYVNEELNVNVSGEAKIIYSGSPKTVNNTSEGTVELIPISK